MSAALPKQADCCSPCDNSSGGGPGVPGPKGNPGTNGTNGTDGVNSFTELINPFTIPAINATDIADVLDSSWAVVGQIVALENGGNGFRVIDKPSAIQVELENLGYPSNQAPATIVPTGSQLGPGGEQGDTGPSPGPITIDDISPTTSQGDMLVDNGANSPNSSIVRQPRGNDGESLCTNTAQPTGVQWNRIHPNASSDNAIVRFNGTAGFPVPGQDSSMVITDDGALQSSPTGGNARGSKAVDLQVERTLATQVASGANSVIAGGKNNAAAGTNGTVGGGQSNSAFGTDSSVAGGDSNQATGAQSHVGGGNDNQASSTAAFVGGGDTNEASGANSSVCAGSNNAATAARAFVGGGSGNAASAADAAVCAGQTNVANAPSSFIGGGENNTCDAAGGFASIPGGSQAITNKYGQMSHASGMFADKGDCQASFLHWRLATTDDTPTQEMFLDGAAEIAAIPADTSWGFHILLVGRDDSGVDALWETKGLIKNNGGTTSLTGSVTQAVLADGTGATWGVSGNVVVDADNGNDSLRIRVTGAAATNIRWHAHARIVELKF